MSRKTNGNKLTPSSFFDGIFWNFLEIFKIAPLKNNYNFRAENTKAAHSTPENFVLMASPGINLEELQSKTHRLIEA